MARVTVVAKRRFYYGGRDVSPGPVEMHAADAAAYARRGFVSLSAAPTQASVLETPVVVSTAPVVEAPASDVVVVENPPAPATELADTTSEAVAPAQPDTAAPAAPERRRRTYRRRDMQADQTAELRADGDPA